MQIKFNAVLKNSFILDPSILLWDALSHVNFYWFFATTAQQQIVFMFLVKTQLVLNFVKVSDFSSQYSWRKYKKTRYLKYVKKV